MVLRREYQIPAREYLYELPEWEADLLLSALHTPDAGPQSTGPVSTPARPDPLAAVPEALRSMSLGQ